MFSIILSVLIIVGLCGCNKQSLNSTNSAQSGITLNGLSKEALKNEQKMLDAEKLSLEHIKNKEVFITQLGFDNPSPEDGYSTAMLACSNWSKSLCFGGFRTDKSILTIYMLGDFAEDYYMFQDMMISNEKDNRFIEYNTYFTKEYDNISLQRHTTFLQAIYGVEIDTNSLKEAISDCVENINVATPDTPYEYMLFNQDNIVIKCSALQIGDNKYIVLHSKYTPSFK